MMQFGRKRCEQGSWVSQSSSIVAGPPRPDSSAGLTDDDEGNCAATFPDDDEGAIGSTTKSSLQEEEGRGRRGKRLEGEGRSVDPAPHLQMGHDGCEQIMSRVTVTARSITVVSFFAF